ncbi:MAG: rRNA maturation RNase YbeY [Caulobacteraceae bacterium]
MIEIEIADAAWTAAAPDADGLARQATGAVAALGAEGSIAVLLTGDDAVRRLNARFRGKDAPTNVLAFPAAAHAGGHLGDIALAFGVCAREAAEQGKTLADHLRHLVIHGVLHLLGYDHQAEDQARRMEAVERQLLAALGVPDPYAEGDHVQRRR